MRRDHDQPPFAERLMMMRQHRYISQHVLAKRAGLSEGMIAALEQGRRGDPRLSTLRKLAVGLGVSVAELVGEEELPTGM